MPDTSTICPRCKADAMSNGVCMFCGPDAAAPSRPKPAVDKGWTGFDRDLGERKRRERADQASAERLRAEPKPGRAWISSAIVAVIVIAAIGFAIRSGRLAPPTAAPSEAALQTASAARPDLILYARSLRELVTDSQHKLLAVDDPSPGDIARFRERLQDLHQTGWALEPRLTRGETRILSALQQGEKHLDRFLKSFGGATPDLTGVEAQAALDQIDRAVAFAHGADMQDVVLQSKQDSDAKAAQMKQVE